MHKLFVAWFVWGFWSYLMLWLLTIVTWILIKYKHDFYFGTSILTVVLTTLNTIAWLSCGLIWRFSE